MPNSKEFQDIICDIFDDLATRLERVGLDLRLTDPCDPEQGFLVVRTAEHHSLLRVIIDEKYIEGNTYEWIRTMQVDGPYGLIDCYKGRKQLKTRIERKNIKKIAHKLSERLREMWCLDVESEDRFFIVTLQHTRIKEYLADTVGIDRELMRTSRHSGHVNFTLGIFHYSCEEKSLGKYAFNMHVNLNLKDCDPQEMSELKRAIEGTVLGKYLLSQNISNRF